MVGWGETAERTQFRLSTPQTTRKTQKTREDVAGFAGATAQGTSEQPLVEPPSEFGSAFWQGQRGGAIHRDIEGRRGRNVVASPCPLKPLERVEGLEHLTGDVRFVSHDLVQGEPIAEYGLVNLACRAELDAPFQLTHLFPQTGNLTAAGFLGFHAVLECLDAQFF